MWNKFALLASSLQIICLVFFFIYVDYEQVEVEVECGDTGDSNRTTESNPNGCQTKEPVPDKGFQDTFFLTLSAFGLTYCYVSQHNVSSLAWCILITALGVQWSVICRGIVTDVYPIRIGILSLFSNLSTATTVLLSWGVLLGKLSPIQLIMLIVIEVPLAIFTEWLAVDALQTKDPGGSMICHEFGAYFGLGVSALLYRRDFVERRDNQPKEPFGDFRCLLGTMIFWCFWPTSVAATIDETDIRQRVFINVFVSMMSSCVTTFALSSIMDTDGKFNLGHIQNATIAGGVAIGTAADSMLGPGGALLTGIIGAVVTILGINYVQPFLLKYLYVHDTLGVHNLHGLVGIVGGTIGAIVIGFSSEEVHAPRLYKLSPSMATAFNTSEFQRLAGVISGLGRTPGKQAVFQVATVLLCFFLPLLTGILTGLLLRIPVWDRPTGCLLFDDHAYWRLQQTVSMEKDDDVGNRIQVVNSNLGELSLRSLSVTPSNGTSALKTNSVSPE